MSGSKSLVSVVLFFDHEQQKAEWKIKSEALRLEQMYSHVEIVGEHDMEYEYYSKLAGPKPEVLVEEVSEIKQGDNNG